MNKVSANYHLGVVNPALAAPKQASTTPYEQGVMTKLGALPPEVRSKLMVWIRKMLGMDSQNKNAPGATPAGLPDVSSGYDRVSAMPVKKADVSDKLHYLKEKIRRAIRSPTTAIKEDIGKPVLSSRAMLAGGLIPYIAGYGHYARSGGSPADMKLKEELMNRFASKNLKFKYETEADAWRNIAGRQPSKLEKVLRFMEPPNYYNSAGPGINLESRNTPASVLAHELGHARGPKAFAKGPLFVASRKYGLTAAIAGILGTETSSNESTGLASAILPTVAYAPTLASEIDASIRGARMLKALKATKGLGLLRPFAGVASYAAIPAFPWVIHGMRKHVGGYEPKLK